MECDLVQKGSADEALPISIHALRMERDCYVRPCLCGWVISIHALRMERDRERQEILFLLCRFQSTRSAWSATGT